MAESLTAFGWQQPIVIDPKRVIVAGHTRHQAALTARLDPCAHGDDSGQAREGVPAVQTTAVGSSRRGISTCWPGELASPAATLEDLSGSSFDAIAAAAGHE